MFLLSLISLLEGFTTLAMQMVALRMATPIVGSSIILTSIYIGVILLALSLGYYFGGIIASKNNEKTIPVILFFYLIFGGLYYLFLTFGIHQEILTMILTSTGSYITTLFSTAFLLFFLPVLAASQTIPLLAEMVPTNSKGRAAGAMLFSSTVGSFLGSVGTSIFLFQYFGVELTAVFVVFILFLCASLSVYKYKKKRAYISFFVCTVLCLLVGYSRNSEREKLFSFVFDSPYQEIAIRETVFDGDPAKIFHTDRAYASGIYTKTKESPFGYIREAIELTKQLKAKKVLVIGTAGFTYPYEISKLPYVKQIDAVDIDPYVKPIAEKLFLETELSEKVNFFPQSARYFVNQAIRQGEKYDIIFLDAYNGKTVPDELVTQEFFAGIRQLADPNRVIGNFILDAQGVSKLSRNITTTMESIFGTIYAKDVSYNPKAKIINVIMSPQRFNEEYKKRPTRGVIYTDDKRSTELDIVDMWKYDK